MFRINTNIASINASRRLFQSSNDVARAMMRLSSGLRINRAADDAAGLTASEGMRSQLVAARQANRNISQAITLLQTADSGYEQVANMLLRLKELATQAADGSLNQTNRSAINQEADALISEIARISTTTIFNSMTLVNSSGTTAFTFYVGDGTGGSTGVGNQKLNFAISGISVGGASIWIGGTSVAIESTSFLNGVESAASVIVNIESAISSLATARSKLGAFQNRLERTQTNIQAMIENTANAESIIRDADFAEETSALTRAQILVQAGTSVLQQANILPQNALLLLQT
jgi:flagellin